MSLTQYSLADRYSEAFMTVNRSLSPTPPAPRGRLRSPLDYPDTVGNQIIWVIYRLISLYANIVVYVWICLCYKTKYLPKFASPHLVISGHDEQYDGRQVVILCLKTIPGTNQKQRVLWIRKVAGSAPILLELILASCVVFVICLWATSFTIGLATVSFRRP